MVTRHTPTTDGSLSGRIAELRPDSDLEDAAVRARVFEGVLGVEPTPVCLGRYVVLQRIGRGGMGTVFAAWDRELDRRVALKVLHRRRGRDDGADLAREARVLARLADPFIVPIYDIGEVGDDTGLGSTHATWIAMELVDGVDLRRWLASDARSVRQILGVLGRAALGLASAHAAGIVHGDVKPENLLVTADGGVRWVDFGLARAVGDRARGGTRGFVAPEARAGGSLDARADIWALCVTSHLALTGRHPDDGIGARPPGVPGRMWRTLVAGLPREPGPRPGAVEFARAAADLGGTSRGRLVGASLALAGVLVAAGAMAADEGGACELDASAASIDGSTHVRLRARLEDAGALGRATLDRIEPRLVAFTDEWQAERTLACRLAQPARSQRVACLGGRAEALARLLDRLVDTDAAVDRIVDAVAALGSPTDCGDQTREPAEITADVATALADARVLVGLADYAGALERAEQALALAERDHLACPAADALALRGSMRLRLDRYDDAADDLAAAYWSASAAGCDAIAVGAGLRLVRTLAERVGDPEAALAWLPHVRSAIARRGDRPEDLASERIETALVARRLGRTDEVRAAAEQAATFAEAPDFDPHIRALGHQLLAMLDTYDGDASGAVEHAAAAFSAMESIYGAAHPDVALTRSILGRSLVASGRRAAGVAELERAAAALGELRPVPRQQHGSVLALLGSSLHQVGRLDDADDRLALAEHELSQLRAADDRDVLRVRLERAHIARERGDLAAAQVQLAALDGLAPPDDREYPVLRAEADGRLALAQRRWDVAAARFGEQLALLTALPDDPGERAKAEVDLARARLGQGDADALELLARNWAPAARAERSIAVRAETAFDLARALAAHRRDRPLAIALAALARAEVSGARPPWPPPDEIDALLRALADG